MLGLVEAVGGIRIAREQFQSGFKLSGRVYRPPGSQGFPTFGHVLIILSHLHGLGGLGIARDQGEGFDAVLRKPFRASDLAALVRRFLPPSPL